ncbi:MAG: type II secretion system protein GspG, partial [Candidatus Omnitrophica bacterium]|nr:type II secretion system protein GspG [Candidatus Omnitrophota bacterium]
VEKANLIINELSFHQGIEPFIKCMDGERVYMGVWAFEEVMHGKISPREMGMWGGMPLWMILYPTRLFRPIQKKDFTYYLTLISEIQGSYNIPFYEYVKDQIEEDIPKYCVLTRLILPALGRVREVVARHQADIDICRTGLALKVYHRANNGNYPEKLEELVSAKLLNEVPVDPFSGKDLVYSRQIGGFKVYSFGPNMQDDFGAKRTFEKDSPAYENYDLVWQSQIQLKRSEYIHGN